MNNIENNITPQDWILRLEQVVDSRAKEPVAGQERLYIGREYIIIDQSKLSHFNPKMSLCSIVDMSKLKFCDLKKEFKAGHIDLETYKNCAEKIAQCTEKLIEGQETKQKQLKWKVVRTLGKIFMTIFSFMPFIAKRLKDRDLKSEISEAKKNSVPFKILEKINNQIEHIPLILQDLESKILVTDRIELLQKRMEEDYPKQSNFVYVDQFRKDMRRGTTFERKDLLRKDSEGKDAPINDRSPQPSPSVSKEDKVVEGAKLLREIDKEWEIALQLVTNQTSINNLFDTFMFVFTIQAAENVKTWKDKGKDYALKAQFSEKMPPIHLEVIRHPNTFKIEKVNIELSGFFDIVSFNTKDSEDFNILFPKAVQGKLFYSFTLDENNRPVIGDLKVSQVATNSVLSLNSLYVTE